MDRLLCVFGAALFSQLPEFIQQYLQRLGGHLDEARHQLDQFQNAAAQTHVTLGQLIANSQASSEPTVAQLGRVMQATVERVHDLASAQAAIENASLFMRPMEFFRHLDFSVASATWSIFRPAVPTTLEGLVYAAFGVVFTLSFYHSAVRYPVRCAWRRRAERRRAAATVAPPSLHPEDVTAGDPVE